MFTTKVTFLLFHMFGCSKTLICHTTLLFQFRHTTFQWRFDRNSLFPFLLNCVYNNVLGIRVGPTKQTNNISILPLTHLLYCLYTILLSPVQTDRVIPRWLVLLLFYPTKLSFQNYYYFNDNLSQYKCLTAMEISY